ncbi:MAG TPA: hypothetical protein VF576_03220, partial [Rubricoccaceae bacterium]
MRLSTSLGPLARTGLVAAALVVAGCSSSRPEPDPPPTSARVGLAATMDIPANPYGDSLDVAAPGLDGALGAAEGADPYGLGDDQPDAAAQGGVTVSRYYYDDQTTYYVDDQTGGYEAYDATDYDDGYYYGGYASDYYRYDDPSYYPSVYSYYRPYRTYRPYLRFGWAGTWGDRYHARRHWRSARYGSPYDPYYYSAAYYDPYYYNAYYFDPYYYGPSLSLSFGWGGGFGYGSGYSDGYYDGYSDASYAGYYGPGYYGNPGGYGGGHSDGGYDDGRDDGERGPVGGTPFGAPTVATM